MDVKLVNKCEKYTQKCYIPPVMLKSADFKNGDIVHIKCNVNSYICRIYCTVHPVTYIEIDDTVTCSSSRNDSEKLIVHYPNDFSLVKASTFDKLQVRVVFENCVSLQNFDIESTENVIHGLISPYVFGKNTSVNCGGIKRAKCFKIHKIIILETFCDENVFGRLKRASTVEIREVLTLEQENQINEIQGITLGGLNEQINFLRRTLLYHQRKNRITILGPPGSGKSSLVKKVCSEIGCNLVIVDGKKDFKFCKQKCDEHSSFLFHSSKIFPMRCSILFIDHIDLLTSHDSKQDAVESVSGIVSLIRNLNNTGVYVIAAATYRSELHSSISCLFEEEIVLGIPTLHQRKEIFETLSKSSSPSEIDCEKLSRLTSGFVGNDIKLLFEEAVKAICSLNPYADSRTPNLITEDFEKVLSSFTPFLLKSSNWNMKVKPIYWKDIGGMKDIKERLQMCIEWPLRKPKIFKKVNLPCPRGILLFGPPGCCKTTLARGLATACDANFFAANPAQIYSPFVGESEKNITELFYQARLCAPSIIFLDELDCLVVKRKFETKSQGIGEKVLSTLLNEMDGFGTRTEFQKNLKWQTLLNCDQDLEEEVPQSDQVIVVAATNRPDLIDDALLRPGRFDAVLYVPAPNLEERESILRALTNKMPITEVDFRKLAQETELFSGADLKNLCNKAAMNALRNNMNAELITKENFEEALKNSQPSITRKQIEEYERLASKYGPVITGR